MVSYHSRSVGSIIQESISAHQLASLLSLSLCVDSQIMIGFSQRTQTVSEADVSSGQDFMRFVIPVAVSGTSEMEQRAIFRVTSRTATVEPLFFTDPMLDAIFGVRDNPEDPIQVERILHPGESAFSLPLTASIRNDFLIEDEECFTIRILSRDVPGRAGFTCNSGSGATNFFCDHTICIQDDDGECSHL